MHTLFLFIFQRNIRFSNFSFESNPHWPNRSPASCMGTLYLLILVRARKKNCHVSECLREIRVRGTFANSKLATSMRERDRMRTLRFRRWAWRSATSWRSAATRRSAQASAGGRFYSERLANFGRSLLGWIEAYDRETRRSFQQFSKSTRSAFLCTTRSSIFAKVVSFFVQMLLFLLCKTRFHVEFVDIEDIEKRCNRD